MQVWHNMRASKINDRFVVVFGLTIPLNMGNTVPNNRHIHIETTQKVISYLFLT